MTQFISKLYLKLQLNTLVFTITLIKKVLNGIFLCKYSNVGVETTTTISIKDNQSNGRQKANISKIKTSSLLLKYRNEISDGDSSESGHLYESLEPSPHGGHVAHDAHVAHTGPLSHALPLEDDFDSFDSDSDPESHDQVCIYFEPFGFFVFQKNSAVYEIHNSCVISTSYIHTFHTGKLPDPEQSSTVHTNICPGCESNPRLATPTLIHSRNNKTKKIHFGKKN